MSHTHINMYRLLLTNKNKVYTIKPSKIRISSLSVKPKDRVNCKEIGQLFRDADNFEVQNNVCRIL